MQLEQKNISTPVMVFSPSKLRQNVAEIQSLFLGFKIFYPVKANSSEVVINELRRLGCDFEASSIFEIDYLLSLNIAPARILFGNPIKSKRDIDQAYAFGVRNFVIDHSEELRKFEYGPCRIYVRVSVDNAGAKWPLTAKFGCEPRSVSSILEFIKKYNQIPYALSFHVGSQQENIHAWSKGLELCSNILKEVSNLEDAFPVINIGGGMPVNKGSDSLMAISRVIMNKIYSDEILRERKFFMEPGRSLVGPAGLILTRVISVKRGAQLSWVYLDIGTYNGLFEAQFGRIEYSFRILNRATVGNIERFNIAGPTCDSLDVLASNIDLPADVSDGDLILIENCGAYTTSYATRNFNGFLPITELFDSEQFNSYIDNEFDRTHP